MYAAIQRQPDPNVSISASEKVTSARKDKTVSKTPDKKVTKSQRWVRGGPIEYSTPPSDHSNDKTVTESVADQQKSSEGTKGKSASMKALAFDGSTTETAVKHRYKDSVSSVAAGGKRKKSTVQQSSVPESQDTSISKGASRKTSKSSAAVVVEPEPVRTKRMARLNAEAIVSLIYKHDEPAVHGSKYRDSSDSDTDSSEISSEDECTAVVQKKRAKKLTSQDDVPGTSKEEHTEPSSNIKGEVHPKTKRSTSKSDKSAKSAQSKVSSKSCKQKPVEAVSSSSWSPPKRMASLNAQVCFYTC